MTKKLSISEKVNRKPASRACVFCHSKHLQCSNERPCRNCVKRNIGHECHDIVRKRAKYMKVGNEQQSVNASSAVSSSIEPESRNSPTSFTVPPSKVHSPHQLQGQNSTRPLQQFHPIQPMPTIKQEFYSRENKMLNTTNDVLHRISGSISSNNGSQFLDLGVAGQHNGGAHKGSTSGAGGVDQNRSPSIDIFNSNYLNQEYLMLGDIILHSKPTSPSPSTSSEVLSQSHIPIASFDPNDPSQQQQQGQGHQHLQVQMPRMSTQQPRLTSSRKKKHVDTRPFISLGFSNPNPDGDMDLDTNYVNFNNSNNNGTADLNEGSILDNKADSKFTVNNQIMQNKNNNNPQSGNSRTNLTQTSSNLPYEYMSPIETHNLYQRVQDIYAKNIVDFEYPQSYHSLTYFLKQRFSGNTLSPEAKSRKRANLLIILKLIASYRPTFISAHKSLLKPYDFQFLEMSFQRSLIDCEKLAQLNSSPTIIWRRTGEIVSLSDDLLSLLGFGVRDILSKRTFIMELMYDDESVVNYFKLFKSVAVGNLHSSIITKCKLIKKTEEASNNGTSIANEGHSSNEDSSSESNDYIEFCSVWTVKRDLFDIPMLIVGQFLPIFPSGEGVRVY